MDDPLSLSIENIVAAFNLLTKSTGDHYYVYDHQTALLHFSDSILAARDIFSLDKTVCSLQAWWACIDPKDVHRLQEILTKLVENRIVSYNLNYRVRGGQGRVSWINSRGSAFYADGQLRYVLGRFSVSEVSKSASSSRSKELKREIRKYLNASCPGYLLLMGVDNLKLINMKHGRNFGDGLLNDVAQIIGDETHHQNQVYRINGDWFAVNLPEFSREGVRTLFARIQERLVDQCTVSGGCVSFTDYHVDDAGTLLQYAESSLDFSKNNGKNMLTFFTPENYEEKLRELELREDLLESVNAGFSGFSLFFQPQIRSETYDLYGAEALLRYQSPRHGRVSPTEFVPILEQCGLMYAVGLWVLRESLRLCQVWRGTLPDFHVSVNMSYSQLDSASITEDVLDLVSRSGLPGNALTIEVTESMELSNYPQLNTIFRAWKHQGIGISVDDFGTGYSSLGRLKELDVDEIKIDRSFVREIQNSAYNYRLLSNIIELADSSQIRVCCEGVETMEELSVLSDLHPALLQGFFFAMPCSEAEFQQRYIDFDGLSTCRQLIRQSLVSTPAAVSTDTASSAESAKAILDAESNIFCLCDLETYELYYMNPAGQKVFGVKDYQGKKCYKVLYGQDKPCESCTNRCLRQDSFYISERENKYCMRRFLSKGKIIPYQGKLVRMEVSMDITKGEYVSQSCRERLVFAEKIVSYMTTLSSSSNYSDAVNQVLASVGDFYQADRAYLFERSTSQANCWDNTFEWCAANVSSQRSNLQTIPREDLSRWLTVFSENRSVILLNLDPLKESSPREWEILHAQDIQRIIAVPIRDGKTTVGFIGVDNPRYSIHDDSQIRVLAGFLLTRMRQDRNEHRYQSLVQESNQDLLSALHVGFWTLDLNRRSALHEMHFDNTMCRLLEIDQNASPKACYYHWFSGLTSAAHDSLRNAFAGMLQTNQLIQVTFPWRHPSLGIVYLRFSGILSENTASNIRFKGYCRIVEAPSAESA